MDCLGVFVFDYCTRYSGGCSGQLFDAPDLPVREEVGVPDTCSRDWRQGPYSFSALLIGKDMQRPCSLAPNQEFVSALS